MAEFRYGCLLAMGITAAAVAAPASASLVSVLNNGGFESTFRNGTFCASLDVTYGPADYGKWAVGDAACSVTGPAFSITPRGGLRMLDFGSVPTGNTSSDVYQIVDLTAYAAEIDAGLVTVDTSAYFNATTAARVGMALLRWPVAPTTLMPSPLSAGFRELIATLTSARNQTPRSRPQDSRAAHQA